MEYLKSLEFTSTIWALILPLSLIILDVITGYTYAWKKNNIKSSKMRDGIGKKCGELCYIMFGILTKFAFGINAIMIFTVFYISYMEILSLFENCAKLGVPMPEEIKKKLNNK